MRSRRFPTSRGLLALGAIFFALLVLLPLTWMFLASLMTTTEVTSVPQVFVPAHPQWGNYGSFISGHRVGGESTSDVGSGLRNSIIVSAAVTAVNLILGSMAAYPLARRRFRGGGVLLIAYLATRMVPTISIVIPIYALMRYLGLLDTLAGLILAYIPYTLPFTIWLLTFYFRLIPRELDEAATMDGCGTLQTLALVIIPVAAPGLVAAGAFAFVTSWSEFILASILTTSPAAKTIPVVATNFATDIYIDYNLLAAAGVVSLLIPVLLAIIFQRSIVGGLSAGAVK